MKILFFSILLCAFSFIGMSQVNFSANYFRLPVDIDFKISSNFGEIRPNHFHAGLDVYTFVKSGINYYSVADGYISRIKVSPRGLGNAIYITHPNGYVSVYAHMSKFRLDIADYIYKLQHNTQQFAQDIYISPYLFPLKSGDYIGKSGNTGNSFGAHLHFELREDASEIPINPLYAFNVNDKVSPKINAVYMYRFNDVKKRYVSKSILKKISGRTIKTFGKIAFGIEIHDYVSNSHNVFGTYKVQLYVDDSLCYAYKMDGISFDETRYINSFVDYQEYKTTRRKITKCFIEPNNKLSIYETKGSGIYDFSDGKLHRVKIIGSDFKGNSRVINFKVLSDSTRAVKYAKKGKHSIEPIDCKKENYFITDSFKVFFHRNSLYYNIDLQYYTSTVNKPMVYSKLHHLHNIYTPIHNRITIKIKADSIAPSLKNKALIAGISQRGNMYAVDSKWNDDYLEANVRNFGTYFVTVDNVKPTIRSLSIGRRKTIKSGILKFKITDNLAGVKEYIAYIDNKWVLFEYDQKKNLITCNLRNEKISKGKHELVLWVKDYCGNIADTKLEFVY